ncbi:class I SAM-dependent methyltransferase [Streptacidiphilus sp. N1-3]|uniref:Class I SAM-dependent methyltransferase n=1 Tax=Streptacidiphilus alkalitolerans TaxID=3342712 RepID=A0ABV6WTJ9_9ACTN
MVNFADVDRRNYPMVDVATGYGQWVETYEQTVEDIMDLALLDALTVPTWHAVQRAVDLGCGTGRTGAWLRSRGVPAIDGVDLTPEMLAVARAKGVHDRLVTGDIRDTGLAAGSYDLLVSSLVDEHLPDLLPLYREAARLAAPGALYVQVSFHPQFILATGMPTHFTSAGGEHIAISTHVHLISENITAGLQAGWELVEMREGLVDDSWVALKPRWEKHRNVPVSAAFVWRRRG